MDTFKFSNEFLSEYEILGTLGSGGMAQVFKARQRSLDRLVAIKLLLPLAFSEEDSRKRFEEEKQLTSRLKHRNVVALLSFGQDQDRPFLVFEFIEGSSLRDLIDRQRKISLEQTVHIALDVASGLAAAHGLKIIHRDLKPDNILLNEDHVAKIADFGLARAERRSGDKLTQTGIILGTPGYLAPEVIRGGAVTASGDLFALGVLIHEMLMGHLPITGDNDRELLIRYSREDIPRLSEAGQDVPAILDTLVAQLVARNPEGRPKDAMKVVRALREVEARLTGLRPRTDDKTAQKPSPSSEAGHRPRAKAGSAIESSRTQRQDGPAGLEVSTRQTPLGRLVVFLVLIAALTGVLFGICFWFRAGQGPKIESRVIDDPTIVMGLSAARIQWSSARDSRTRLWIWADGFNEHEGRIHSFPTATAEIPCREHSLLVRQLTPRQRHFFRIVFDDDTRSKRIYSLPESASPESLACSFTYRFIDPESLSAQWNNVSSLTAGFWLKPDGGSPIVTWDTSSGPHLCRMKIKVPRQNILYQTGVCFRELDEEDVIRGPALPGCAKVRSIFLDKTSDPSFQPLGELTKKMLRIPYSRFPSLARHQFRPGPKLAERLNPGQKQIIRGDLMRCVSEWFKQHIDIDLELLRSAAPLWLTDTAAPPIEKARVYETLARLNEIDGASEMMLGEPLIDIESWCKRLVSTEYGPPIPTDGFRPLANLTPPAARAVVKNHYLSLFSDTLSLDKGGVMDALLERTGTFSDVRKAHTELMVQDSNDPEHKKGVWYALGDIPPSLPVSRGLEIFLRTANLEPNVRLWLRIGERRLSLSQTLTACRPSVTITTNPSKSAIEHSSSTLCMRVGPYFLADSDRRISAKIDVFDVTEHEKDVATHGVWLLDLVIRPVEDSRSR